MWVEKQQADNNKTIRHTIPYTNKWVNYFSVHCTMDSAHTDRTMEQPHFGVSEQNIGLEQNWHKTCILHWCEEFNIIGKTNHQTGTLNHIFFKQIYMLYQF